ncbi:hypothetical protein LSAT2_015341 [Lamellibrachia satsuma]|nr:hypothetical protein LSAT2_015341 [Lamellibrachia satsuma]
MAYATGEQAYQQLYQALHQTKHEAVLTYFDSNWHGIKEQWVEGLKEQWMEGLKEQWMEGLKEQWVEGLKEQWVEGLKEQWMEGLKEQWVEGLKEQWVEGLKEQWMEGLKERWVEGLKEQWVEGLKERWVEGLKKQWVEGLKEQWVEGLKEQWVEGLKVQQRNFLTRTNNRVESINQKLKSVITKFSNIVLFFKDLKVALSMLETERNYRIAQIVQKTSVIRHAAGSPEEAYCEFLTPYAFRYVTEQLSAARSRDDTRETATFTSCDCGVCDFWTAMGLPCRHIFRRRLLAKEDLFDGQLVLRRWQKVYYLSSYEITSTVTPTATSTDAVDIRQLQLIEEEWKRDEVSAAVCQPAETAAHTDAKTAATETAAHADAETAVHADATETAATKTAAHADAETAAHAATETASHADAETATETVALLQPAPSILCVIPNQQQPLCLALDDIKMPPPIRKRGRPKGAEMTVIGLPKKRKMLTRPVPFLKRSSEEKECIIMRWFVKAEVAEKAMNGGELISCRAVEKRPEKVPMKCTDENVDLNRIRKYFRVAGWEALLRVVGKVTQNGVWKCKCVVKEQAHTPRKLALECEA